MTLTFLSAKVSWALARHFFLTVFVCSQARKGCSYFLSPIFFLFQINAIYYHMKTDFFRNHRKLTIALLVIAFLILLWIFWLGYLYFKLESIKCEIRKSGAPVTLKELDDRYPKVPDSENAAAFYKLAAEAYVYPNNEKYKGEEIYIPECTIMPMLTDPLDEKRFSATVDFFKMNRTSLDLFKKANGTLKLYGGYSIL